jgi:hypothetical protein
MFRSLECSFYHLKTKKAYIMKTNNIFTKGAVIAVLLGGLFFTSCKKESTSSSPEEVLATEESTANDAESDAVYDDVFNTSAGIGAEAGDDLGFTSGVGIYGKTEGSSVNGRTLRCFTIVAVPNTPGVFPKTVTINFGAGCTGPDGKVRKGKIIIVYSGPMRIPGSKATTSFEGYKVDSVAVEGTHEVINNSTNSTKILTVRVISGKLTWDSGRWVKWSTTRTYTQIEGGATLSPLDDIIQITGAGRGENNRGVTWAHEIIEPLVKKFICRWISKGIIRITYNNTRALLNYGAGNCDNKATLTINGRVKEIILR